MNFVLRLLSAVLICLFLTTFVRAGTLTEKPDTDALFIDLDGDGFNDEALDPEHGTLMNQETEEEETVSEPSDTAPTINPFAAFGPTPAADLPMPNSDRFIRRQFAARGLDSNRSDFESGFGSSTGTNTGTSSGGACAGGVCLPH